jgi:hypothetical protein
MSNVYWKIIVYPKTTTGWSAIGTELTKAYDVQLNITTGSGKDSFNFKISDLTYDIDYEDKIEIYQRDGYGIFTADDLLMLGVIRTVTPSRSGLNSELTVSGYNFSESVMSGLVFVDAINLTIPEMFKESINSLVLASKDFTVTWNDSNPLVNSKGASFPLVGETLFNKPFKDLLDKYSAEDRTKDGNYHWYVNRNNQLTWGANKGVSTNTFDEASMSFNSIKFDKDVNDVRNFVVVKGGFDPKSRVLQERYADYSSISKHGFKYYILTSENKTGGSVLELDKLDFGVDDMRDATYPLTPRWSLVSVSSFNDYANKFRDYMRAELKSIGKSFVDMRKNGKLKVTVNFKPFNHTYIVGSLVTCTFITETGLNGPMRVKEINYTKVNDSVTFEEDDGTL